MSFFDTVLDRIGLWLANIIQRPTSGYAPFTQSDPAVLRKVLQPGDVLLIEGNQKLSTAIKYLTQSTWSHAALYTGEALDGEPDGEDPACLIEANLGEGVVAVPLSKYASFNTRICRPVGLVEKDRDALLAFMKASLGHKYDTRQIFDLARYLIPTPPVPTRWRRKMIAFGSGDPSRAICSTLIAHAFQTVHYPVLPLISTVDEPKPHVGVLYSNDEILHIRHYSLYAPRDFDVSPYFAIIKPTIAEGFDYTSLQWGDPVSEITLIG